MRKVKFLRFSAFLLSLMMMAGCASGGTPSSDVPDTDAPSSQEASAPAEDSDSYPERPIRFILPNGAGGSMEKSSRKWQAYFEKAIGVPLQFEFVEGSGTLIGTNVVAEAEPDGYTLMMLSGFDFCNTIATLAAPYNLDSFDVLGINMQDATAVMVRNDAPWDTMRELLDYMKTQPAETVSMALTNLACSDTLGVKEIEAAEGVKFNSVAFNSGSKARTALVGGQAQVGHFSLFGSQAILGDVKILAIHTADNPFDLYKDVPTVNEVLGTTVSDITSDYGVMAPAGFMEQYPERAEKLIAAFHAAWTDPEFVAMLEETEENKIYNVLSPEDATTHMKNLLAFVEENKGVLTGE
ncbi:MAG: tripartite tricarboxylate transporter substrate binding protein [Acetanaerobacterium sp.]